MIKIDEINRRAIMELTPKDYFLKKLKEENDEEFAVLVHRIDMDYAGKPDQEGSIAIYLDEEEYNKLKGIFDEII